MSATLHLSDVSAAFGPRWLFTGLDLVVAPGEVIGLVGPNGAGKTTLLRMLAGLGARRSPARSPGCRPRRASATWPRNPTRHRARRWRGFLRRRTGVAERPAGWTAPPRRWPTGEPGSGRRLRRPPSTAGSALGGADLDDRIPAPCSPSSGLAVDPDAPMTTLSGGQAARAALASLLLARFDVFALDEPTNDLDLAGLDLLEAS